MAVEVGEATLGSTRGRCQPAVPCSAPCTGLCYERVVRFSSTFFNNGTRPRVVAAELLKHDLHNRGTKFQFYVIQPQIAK